MKVQYLFYFGRSVLKYNAFTLGTTTSNIVIGEGHGQNEEITG